MGGVSILKRISDEVARPIYATSPSRRVLVPGEDMQSAVGEDGNIQAEEAKPPSPSQQAYRDIAKDVALDAKMDLVARLLVHCQDMFLFLRYVKDQGLCLDVLTPDMVTVIIDPEQPTRAIAIGYTVATDGHGDPTIISFWDNKEYFRFDVGQARIYNRTPHDFECIPIVDIHRRARWGSYWDETTGNDLFSADLASMLLDLIAMKKVKSQSHIQLTYQGDLEGLVKDQVSDEESVLVATGGKGGQFSTINLESDPSKVIALKDSIQTAVAASYGISRDRLNQTTQGPSDDAALQERVSELAKVLVDAEVRTFEVAKAVSREDPEYIGKITEDATLILDLGQLHNRVDRATQLAVRQTERSMGIRSGVDDVLEDNPEFGGDRTLAMAFIREKMGEEAIIIEQRRKLNAPADTTVPGNTPQENGATGPVIRDATSTNQDDALGQVLAVKAIKTALTA